MARILTSPSMTTILAWNVFSSNFATRDPANVLINPWSASNLDWFDSKQYFYFMFLIRPNKNYDSDLSSPQLGAKSEQSCSLDVFQRRSRVVLVQIKAPGHRFKKRWFLSLQPSGSNRIVWMKVIQLITTLLGWDHDLATVRYKGKGREKCPAVFSSLDYKTRLTRRCTMYTAYTS